MKTQLSPMMATRQRLKAQLPDTLLAVKMGDFYEFFLEDAKEVARILNVTLTKRRGTPMAGVPFHNAHNCFRQLVKSGCRVAVIENITSETPVYYNFPENEIP